MNTFAYHDIRKALDELHNIQAITHGEYINIMEVLYEAVMNLDKMRLYKGIHHFPLHYLVDSIKDVIPSTVKGHEVMKPFQSFLYTRNYSKQPVGYAY